MRNEIDAFISNAEDILRWWADGGWGVVAADTCHSHLAEGRKLMVGENQQDLGSERAWN